MGLPTEILKGGRAWNTNLLEAHGRLLSGHDDALPRSPFRNEQFTPTTAGGPMQELPSHPPDVGISSD